VIPNKSDDQKHALEITKKIMEEIPSKLQRQTKKFEILLVNEKVSDKGIIRVPGVLELKGMVMNVHMKIKILAIIKKHCGNRKIKDMLKV
jgi:hypothetical protein